MKKNTRSCKASTTYIANNRDATRDIDLVALFANRIVLLWICTFDLYGCSAALSRMVDTCHFETMARGKTNAYRNIVMYGTHIFITQHASRPCRTRNKQSELS